MTHCLHKLEVSEAAGGWWLVAGAMLRDARMTRQSVAAAGRDKINHGGQMDKSFIFFWLWAAGGVAAAGGGLGAVMG